MKKGIIVIIFVISTICTMAQEIVAEININGTKEKVWKVLTNFDNYNNWNPQIQDIKVDLKYGGGVEFNLLSDNKKTKINSKIEKIEENRHLEWGGGVPYIFSVRHSFIIKENQNGGIKFIQREVYSGIAALFIGLFDNGESQKLREDFEKVNQKIKIIVEEEK